MPDYLYSSLVRTIFAKTDTSAFNLKIPAFMRPLSFILLPMAFAVCATPQSASDFPAELEQAVVHYTYDASGNRIERSGKMTIVANGSDSTIVEIRAYPNPTTDILNVEIQGMENGTLPATFSSLDGNRTERLYLEPVSKIELDSYPQGWYLLNIEISETEVKTVKILKR